MPDIKKVTEELKKHFGFDTFKGNQEEIILNLLSENDSFVLMPTGGGKSLCYQLPSLMMEGTAIVISPLIALMKNQVDAMRHFSEDDSIAHFLNSTLNRQAIDQVKEDVYSGKTKLLYVAPESFTKKENIEFLRSVKISFYAVDEAHCRHDIRGPGCGGVLLFTSSLGHWADRPFSDGCSFLFYSLRPVPSREKPVTAWKSQREKAEAYSLLRRRRKI